METLYDVNLKRLVEDICSLVDVLKAVEPTYTGFSQNLHTEEVRMWLPDYFELMEDNGEVPPGATIDDWFSDPNHVRDYWGTLWGGTIEDFCDSLDRLKIRMRNGNIASVDCDSDVRDQLIELQWSLKIILEGPKPPLDPRESQDWREHVKGWRPRLERVYKRLAHLSKSTSEDPPSSEDVPAEYRLGGRSDLDPITRTVFQREFEMTHPERLRIDRIDNPSGRGHLYAWSGCCRAARKKGVDVPRF